jgi:hypothetical protein
MSPPVTPAAEKARRDASREALAKLATGRSHTKKQLFEYASGKLVGFNFQRDFLLRLKTMGLVELGPGRGKNTEYQLAAKADLSDYLNNESSLTRLVFPNANPTLEDVQDSLADTPVADPPVNGLGANPGGVQNGAETQPEPSDFPVPQTPVEEMLIKIQAALLENVLALRQRLDEMQPKINEAHEILCELRDPKH